MKAQKFYKIAEQLFDECMEIMKTKGIAYSGIEDKFGNFKRIAKSLCMSPEAVWFVYFAKHLDALTSYIRGEYSDSEPIKGRIQDMINYLFLLYGLIVEDKEMLKDCKDKIVDCKYPPNYWRDPDDLPDNYTSGTDYKGKVMVVGGDDEEKEEENS